MVGDYGSHRGRYREPGLSCDACLCRSAAAMEVIGALAQGQRRYGLPTMIRVDRGSQFTSKEVNLWAYANRITLQSSREARPTMRTLKASTPPRPRMLWVDTDFWIWTTTAKRLKNGEPSTPVRMAPLVRGRPMSLIHRPQQDAVAATGRRFSPEPVEFWDALEPNVRLRSRSDRAWGQRHWDAAFETLASLRAPADEPRGESLRRARCRRWVNSSFARQRF